jgi:hypothetical protein
MNVWAVNTSALVPQASRQQQMQQPQAASSGKADWGRLIGDRALVEELRDFFCYAQLMTQLLDTTGGFDVTGERAVTGNCSWHGTGQSMTTPCCCAGHCATTGRVPAAALADLMRAAGFYPSDADIEGLQAHVKFLADMAPQDDAELCGGDSVSGQRAAGSADQGAAAGQTQRGGKAAAGRSVDLDTFLQLYLSHRPVVELGQQQIQAAFATLAPSTGGVCVCLSCTA